jgi:hypothetical protein
MKISIFQLLLTIGCLTSVADAGVVPKKKLHLGKYEFEVHEVRPEVWVSDHCLKSCDALKAVDRYRSMPKKPDGDLGGKNPWAWRCVNRAGGMVAVVGDESGNQVSFCMFKDDSLVNTKAFD